MHLLPRSLIGFSLALVATAGATLSLGALPLPALTLAALGAIATGAAAAIGARRWPAPIAGIFAAILLVGSHAGPSPDAERLIGIVGEGRVRAEVAGRVERLVGQSPWGWTLDLQLRRLDRVRFADDPPTIRLFVPGDFAGADEPPALDGDRVEVFVRLERYPGRLFPGQPGFRRLMEGRGVIARATAVEPPAVEAGEVGLSARLARRLALGRSELERTLLDHLPAEHAALAVALTTGNRAFIDPSVAAPFRDTGTGHLLAISGLHLGVLAAVVWALVGALVNRSTWLLRRFGRRRACGLAVVALLGCYVLAIGAPVSAVRAWVGLSVGIAALLLVRPICPFHALALAACVLTFAQPSVVAELGFQLSFGATLGILLFLHHRPAQLRPPEEAFADPEPPWRRRLRRVGLFVGVSISATLSTWPVVAAHLGEIPAAGLLVNLVVTPLVSAAIFPLLAVGTVVTVIVEPVGLAVVEAAASCLLVLGQGLAWVARRPGAIWVTGALSWWAVGALGAGALLVVTSRLSAHKLMAALVAAAIGLSPAWTGAGRERGALRLHFIPVGQGDATLVEFPDGQTMLVDGGGRRRGRDPGRFVVVPYLRRLGIAQLDWVVVTHSDADHIGGLFAVVEQMRPRRLVFDARDESERLADLVERAGSLGSRLHPVGANLERGLGGVSVEFVRPDVIGGGRNDTSLVARLAYGAAAVLLAGDVERRGENWLVDSANEMRAVLLKVPHHGSRTSSTPRLLDAVRPNVAVVSAGRFNHFGHPHPEVLARYRRRGIAVYQTARRGLVRAEIDRAGVVRMRVVQP